MSYSVASLKLPPAVMIISKFSSNRGAYSPPRRLYELIPSSRKHPYHLSGRFLFLFMAQVTLATGFHFRNILLDRSAVRWRHSQVCPFLGDFMGATCSASKQLPKVAPVISLFRRILSISITALAFTAVTFAAYILAFGLMRAVALPILFQIPLVSYSLRPFLGHFIRGRWSLVYLWRNRALAWNCFFLGLTTIWGWEFAESLFDDKVQEVRVIFCKTRLFLKDRLHSPWWWRLAPLIPCSHLFLASRAVIHIMCT